MLFQLVVSTLWAMLPAYFPNNVAVVAGGGPPIDGGRTLGGCRLLGDGKTWRGTAAGTIAGTVLALALNAVRAPAARALGVDLPTFPIRVAVTLAFGAMLGDIVASFFKRRLGRERGSAFPVLDQLDFVVGSLGLTAIVTPRWFVATFSLPALVVVAVATPVLHLVTNGIGYLLGIKNEPW